jgi:hypothetical protein
MIAELPLKGGSSVTPELMQKILIRVGLTRILAQGSSGVPAPL